MAAPLAFPTTTIPRRARSAAVLAVVLVAVAGPAATSARATQITTPLGPLTTVGTTADLNCYVNHLTDVASEFFGTTACGTLVATADTLFGPASIPAGSAASPRTPWTPESQSGVSGTGTAADPFRMTTIVTGGPLRLTQVDSYQAGLESYRTDVTVQNLGTDQQTIVIYRAGDCYLANSDLGYGRVDDGAPTCVEANPDRTPGNRIEQFTPITGQSHYFHNGYWDVWAAIGTRQPFPDTCRCDEFMDNGAGVSWTRTVAPGESATVSGLITFSPTGNLPLVISKTSDDVTVSPNSATGYTIHVHNPNARDVALTSLIDDLPSGFRYLASSTSGLTTAEPAITGSRLTWTGPLNVPGNTTATLHFSAAVPATPGTYKNTASGTADSYTIVPAEEEAPVNVPVSPIQTDVADVVVEKTADDGAAGAGQLSGYTVTLSNPTDGPLQATGIDETLHEWVTYQAGSTTGIATGDPRQSGRRLHWDLDLTIPARTSAQMHFGVRLPLDAAGVLANTRISATERQGTTNVHSAVVAQSAPITVIAPAIRGALHLDKSFGHRVIAPGQPVRVSLKVTDLAPKTATVTRICDRVPRGFSVTAAPGATHTGRILCWRVPLPKDDPDATVRYVVRAAAGRRGLASSRASVTGVARDPDTARASVLVRTAASTTAPVTTG